MTVSHNILNIRGNYSAFEDGKKDKISPCQMTSWCYRYRIFNPILILKTLNMEEPFRKSTVLGIFLHPIRVETEENRPMTEMGNRRSVWGRVFRNRR
jgi:hypothetical protein